MYEEKKDKPLWRVANQKDGNDLLNEYDKCFYRKFGSNPVHDSNDVSKVVADFQWMCGTLGKDKAKRMIAAYFALKDEWLIGRAFPPQYIRKNINKILASGVIPRDVPLEKFVVAFTYNGEPVVSSDPNNLVGDPAYMEPIPWDDFIKKHPEYGEKEV